MVDGALDQLYACLRPPPGTVVICIDEKTGIQAKSRRYPQQPAAPGRLARREFGYVRHGTVSIIMDNGSSHTSRATRAWIAAHPRITVTCTPQHASWLDMAELWFSILTRTLLRCGEFTSRADLAAKIITFAIRYTTPPHLGPGPTTPAPTTSATAPATAPRQVTRFVIQLFSATTHRVRRNPDRISNDPDPG